MEIPDASRNPRPACGPPSAASFTRYRPRCSARTFPPHLGGGTILAARWKHRVSTDIDVLLPGRNTLIDLLQDNDRNIVDQLGGTPEAVAAGRVKIAFEHGFLDISTFRPDPPYGDAVATVDGQLERVLSSHQILCGKLERADQMLVRDVFDVLTAADEDPAALAAAAGMVSRQRAAFIESAWREAAGMLADNFHDSIRGARRADATRLGPEAAAFQAHRYTRLEIDLHGDTLSIRKTISAGRLEPEIYAAGNAGRALARSGVATHLNNNGPVTAPQVLAAIRAAVNAGTERTILDSASRSSIDMINRLNQVDLRRPQPTVPGQAQARTRNKDHGYDR